MKLKETLASMQRYKMITYHWHTEGRKDSDGDWVRWENIETIIYMLEAEEVEGI